MDALIEIVGKRSPERLETFKQTGDLDIAYQDDDLPRFRVNAFRQRGHISFAFRVIPKNVPNFEMLGLPPGIRRLAEEHRGLVLVTGATGSGKSTTLAAMIDHINNTKPVHILTVEDPIEVLHADRLASINQREIGVDTENFVNAMRAAMRQDPDVILIGEMRDPETVAAALAAGETGHLVLSTLHTQTATETINRVVDFFPPTQQHQVRVSLASVLSGVICQRLVSRSGGGRVPALEIMVNNGRTAERILDPDRTSEIEEIIAEGSFYGMQTFDQSLLGLVMKRLVTTEEALHASTNPHDFMLALEQAGETVPA